MTGTLGFLGNGCGEYAKPRVVFLWLLKWHRESGTGKVCLREPMETGILRKAAQALRGDLSQSHRESLLLCI